MEPLAESLLSFLPKPLHRHILRTIWRCRNIWRRVYYRPSEGCAVIIRNEAGHILLVRHTYADSNQWMLPAGQMKRDETPIGAAQREIDEEVGCKLSAVRLLEFEDKEFWGRRHTTYIVAAESNTPPEPDLREIEEAAFFPLSDLPESLNDPARARLDRLRVRDGIPFAVPPFVRVDYVKARYEGQSA